MSEPPAMRVLVVDDDADTRSNFRDILELDGYAVDVAGSLAEATGRRDWSLYSAILLDRRLPDGTAEDLLPRIRDAAPEAAVIIITGFADLQGTIAALRQGAADYILKPISPDALRASLARVAERRRLTLAKERSEAAFRTLVESAPCMIVILGADLAVLYFSPFAEDLTGHRAGDVLGKNFLSVFFPETTRVAADRDVQQVLAGKPARGYENAIQCRDGSQRWMIWNAQLLSDYEGKPAILAVGQDITRLRESQERALQAERLAAIGQMVTGLAHESGNALARSQACLEMLALEIEDKPEALELIGRIQKAQDHLRQLYEEVRGYAAPMRLERERVDLARVWRQAWENLAVARQKRQAALREETAGIDLVCSVDLFRVEQVFRNLFDNSLAACQDPVEVVIAASEATLDDRPAVAISILDNGPGLAPEQRLKIFEPFFTTKTKGTGLGMAIAKRIVEAHGGRIAVGAGRGQGAEIAVTLPREAL